jgi:hypothetical protein
MKLPSPLIAKPWLPGPHRCEVDAQGNARCRPSRRSQSGVSLLVILALLACMAIMLAANSTALSLLKAEIKRIDRQQQLKYGQSARH